MSEELDPRMEAFFQEAKGREDVYRFRQVLRSVAADVESREAETPVISINRKRIWSGLAIAASVALLVTVGIVQFWQGPDMNELAMTYTEATVSMTRSDGSEQVSPLELAFDEARTLILAGRTDQAIKTIEASEPVAPCEVVRKHWLLGLAYLLDERLDDAKHEIQTVANSGCQDKEAAGRLLKEV